MKTDSRASRRTSDPRADALALVAGQLIPERRVEVARQLGLSGAAAAAPGPVADFVDAARAKRVTEKQLIAAIGHRELKQVASDLGLSAMGFDRESLEREVLELLDPATQRETRADHVPVEKALPTDLTRLSLEKRADDLQHTVDRLTRAHRFALGLGGAGFVFGVISMGVAHGTLGAPFYFASMLIFAGALMERYDLPPFASAALFAGVGGLGATLFLVAYSIPGAVVMFAVTGMVLAHHRRHRADLPV